jgi:hypothetical protein
MKRAKHIIWLLLIAAASPSLALAAKDAPVTAPSSQSTFEIPASVKDGRDPFFPESARMAEAHPAPTSATNAVAEVTSLKVLGISGTPGHLLTIINNHTFGVGDEGDVITPSGRLHLRCIEVQHDSVTVEVNGRIHRIKVDQTTPLQSKQTP